MRPQHNPKVTVILANLGTPNKPTPKAVAQFLKQFLSDQRVVAIPQFIWFFILRLFVIPLRKKRVAHAYQSIWQNDSPMRQILNQQVADLNLRLAHKIEGLDIVVKPAMTYGQPSIEDVLTEASQHRCEHVVIVPLYPQYSATTTAAVYDAISRYTLKTRNLPSISVLKDYFAHPLYIQALAQSVLQYQAVHGKPQKLLMSFHGIPTRYTQLGDPYALRCRCTAAHLAQVLGLQDNEWAISFQSRFGKAEWEKPYTDAVLTEWACQGVQSVQVISPAFSADCLETLEELAIENKALFEKNGGKSYGYIPALNTNALHIDMLEELTLPLVIGLAGTMPQFANASSANTTPIINIAD